METNRIVLPRLFGSFFASAINRVALFPVNLSVEFHGFQEAATCTLLVFDRPLCPVESESMETHLAKDLHIRKIKITGSMFRLFRYLYQSVSLQCGQVPFLLTQNPKDPFL